MSYIDEKIVAQPASQDTRTRLRRDFSMPLATIAGLVSLVMVAGVHFGVKALNEESAAREMQLVRNGLDLRVSEVDELIVPQVNWDDAVRNLDNRFDPAWTSSNLNEFLDHAWGFDGQVVLDAQDKPIFAAFDGTVVGAAEYARIARHSQKLVESVRRQEVARGPMRRQTGSPHLMSKAIQASDLKQIDGQLSILTASLVQPDFGTAMPAGPRAPIVVTQMKMDKPFLAQFSRRFLLDDVKVRLPDQPGEGGRNEIPVRDSAGEVQTWMTWKPLDPGYGMLRRMALPFFGAMLLVLVFAAVELRRIFRAARELIARDELPEILFWQADEGMAKKA